MKHDGTLEDLQMIIKGYGFNVSEVKNQERVHQIRTSDGAIVNWHTTTGEVVIQGKKPAKDRLIEAMKAEINKKFVDAYNNFDSRPLEGEFLRRFYMDDLAKDLADSIISTIQITERYRKILIVGHTGCGKSTILNKIADDLKGNYHIVSFSISDDLIFHDVETIDVLMNIYLQLIRSMKEKGVEPFLKPFQEVMERLSKKLQIKEVGLNFLKTLSFKIMVDTDSRSIIREEFRKQIEELSKNISKACKFISKQVEKDILIIIDGLDKLKDEYAEKIFFEEFHLLTMLKTKIIFTFPLSTYYSPSFVQKITDKFTLKFIHLISLKDINGKYKENSKDTLKRLVLKRIDTEIVDEDALKLLIDKSGGLVRDLIKFMQDACSIAITEGIEKIINKTSEKVIREKINEYNRLFDFPKFKDDVRTVIDTKSKNEIDNERLVYLLRYLFVLEYGKQGEKSWYDAHPCLKENLLKGT